jgi:hypothetical protein
MKGRDTALILFAALCCVTTWLIGYHQGQQTGAFHLLREMGADSAAIDAKSENDGIEKGREQVCNEIRRYKFSMAKDLDENTQICGWRDMDNLENSN